jgi:hypothetical protein
VSELNGSRGFAMGSPSFRHSSFGISVQDFEYEEPKRLAPAGQKGSLS